MKPLYILIKERRQKLGFSMEELAEKIGVSWQTIQQWEKAPDLGGTSPRRKRSEAVAKALGLPLEDFLLGITPGDKVPSAKNGGVDEALPAPELELSADEQWMLSIMSTLPVQLKAHLMEVAASLHQKFSQLPDVVKKAFEAPGLNTTKVKKFSEQPRQKKLATKVVTSRAKSAEKKGV